MSSASNVVRIARGKNKTTTNIVGTMPPASAQRRVRYSWSDEPRRETGWKVADAVFYNPDHPDDPGTSFLAKVADHKEVDSVADKAKGFTWCAGIISGERRTDNAVTAFDGLIAFDFDLLSDADVERLKSFLEGWGVTCVLISSISHRLPYTNVAVDDLRKFADANGLPFDEAHLVEVGRAYLASKSEKYFPETVASVDRAVIVTSGRDTPEIDIYHAPQNRYRLIVLEKDARPCDVLNIAKGEADHRQFYIDVCELLAANGFEPDRTCSNRGRMFYGSRHVAGYPYDVTVYCGDGPLDAATVPQTDAGRAAAAKVLAGKGKTSKAHTTDSAAPKGFGAYQFRTPWLADFIRKHAHDFHAADWYDFRFQDDVRAGGGGDKITGRCPWEHKHSPTDGPDMGWIICNAGTMPGVDGFHIGCRHNTCNGPEYSNGDRARHLDELIADWNDHAASGDAIDATELLSYCPTHQEAEQTQQDAVADLDALLKTIKHADDVSGADIKAACDLIVAAHPDDKTQQDGAGNKLFQVAKGWTRRQIDGAVSEARARAVASRATTMTRTPVDAAIPADLSSAAVIWTMPSVWDKPTQRKATQARWEKLNTDAPNLYRMTNRAIAQVDLTIVDKDGAPDPQFVVVSPSDLTTVLDADMTDRAPDMTFMSLDDRTNTPQPDVPPPHVLAYMRGKSKSALRLPRLDRLQRVPVYVLSPSGEPYVLTKPGYDASSGLYYAPPPGADFIAAPIKPTADDVQAALAIINDIDRDIPFSDGYGENPPDANEPIYSDDVDEDGHRLPNYKRGHSSRANFRALCLQPFVRNLIPSVCPQYHIDKPESGTGAGLLVDMFANATNWQDRATVKTLPHGDEEIRKTLLSMLLSGRPYAFIDNVQTGVTNPDLMAMLTAGVYSGRMLGGLTDVDVAVQLTMIMAGNNIAFKKDMLRRNVPILIDAETPNPETDRQAPGFFKHARIWAHLRDPETRVRLVWAYHVLANNWLAKGCPRPKLVPVVGSFEECGDVLGGILEAAGIHGFLATHAAYMSDRAGDDITPPQAVTARIYEKCGTDEKSISELLEALSPFAKLRRLSEKAPTIDPELGLALKGDGEDEAAMLKSLGRHIAGWRNTFAMPDGTRVRWTRRHGRTGAIYRLKRV